MATPELYPLLSFVLALGIAYLLVPVLIKIGQLKRWYDQPDERKHHTGKISSLGGVAILLGWTIPVLLFADWQSSESLSLMLGACLLLGFVGFKDDLSGMRAGVKFLFQLLTGGLIFLAGFSVGEMANYLLGWILPMWLDAPLSLLFMATMINAFNFIDGIDGLAGSLALINALVFGVLFWLSGDAVMAVLSFSLAGSLLGFLRFNLHQARIFMGDCGSMFLGLMTALLCMKYFQTVSYSALSPLPALAMCILPFFDLLRVAFFRILKNGSPFMPDRTHIHHLLLEAGLPAILCCAFLCGLHVYTITLLYQLGVWGILASMVSYAAFVGIFQYLGAMKTVRESFPASV